MSVKSEDRVSTQIECTQHQWTKCQCSCSPLVKRYVRKGIPNEYRTLIWMAASGAQDQFEKNPGYYQSLLVAQHDPKLVETICTGQSMNSQPYRTNTIVFNEKITLNI